MGLIDDIRVHCIAKLGICKGSKAGPVGQSALLANDSTVWLGAPKQLTSTDIRHINWEGTNGAKEYLDPLDGHLPKLLRLGNANLPKRALSNAADDSNSILHTKMLSQWPHEQELALPMAAGHPMECELENFSVPTAPHDCPKAMLGQCRGLACERTALPKSHVTDVTSAQSTPRSLQSSQVLLIAPAKHGEGASLWAQLPASSPTLGTWGIEETMRLQDGVLGSSHAALPWPPGYAALCSQPAGTSCSQATHLTCSGRPPEALVQQCNDEVLQCAGWQGT